jgi:hypothetical protein
MESCALRVSVLLRSALAFTGRARGKLSVRPRPGATKKAWRLAQECATILVIRHRSSGLSLQSGAQAGGVADDGHRGDHRIAQLEMATVSPTCISRCTMAPKPPSPKSRLSGACSSYLCHLMTERIEC